MPGSRRRQPLLFATSSPLIERLGAGFFREVPESPGVYFFYDATGGLLYIGQSSCLRGRLRSYRHVDPARNPRRTLRLIHRTWRIEWRICASAADAVALEAALLLEERPPFNRAGVWPAGEWWVHVARTGGVLTLRLSRGEVPEAGEAAFGPFPARMRIGFPSLARCLYRAMLAPRGWWDFPAGLLQPTAGRLLSWKLAESCDGTVLTELGDFLAGRNARLVERFAGFPMESADATATAFWEEQVTETRSLFCPADDAVG